jgi:hypothetical protein
MNEVFFFVKFDGDDRRYGLERQCSIHHVHKAKKTMTSQIHVPDASVRPMTLARKTEKDSLQ